MTWNSRTMELHDEALPAVHTLLGPGVTEVLEAAGVVRPGDSLVPGQVSWRPGHSLTAMYRTGGEWPLVAMTARKLPEGATLVERGDERVSVWRLPEDPFLPGLAAVLDPERAKQLVSDLGVDADSLRATVRAYRPGRRAVVELRGDSVQLFVKVLRPKRIQALQEKHAAAVMAVRVPMSHGWSPEHGIVVLEALPGRTLRQALEDGSSPLPPVEAIARMLEGLPEIPGAVPAEGPRGAASLHSRLLRRVVPECESTIAEIVEELAKPRGPEAIVPVHGDLHEAQLMTVDGVLTGVLDIDTLGLGRATDDYGNLVGHLATWGPLSAQPERARQYARAVLAYADERWDPAELRLAAAATIFGLATGPFRVQSPAWPEETAGRLDAALEWIRSARLTETRKNALT